MMSSSISTGAIATNSSCPPPQRSAASALPCHGHAILKNNEAVYCLETGDYARAVSTLATALQFMKQALKERKNSLDDNVQSSSSSSCCDSSTQAGGGVRSVPSGPLVVASPATTAETYSLEGNKYLYKFARRITEVEGNFDTAEANNELSVVIVFNLASAHHLTAVTCHPIIGSPLRLGNLRKACTLYEHGYQLTVNAQRFVDPTRAMALLNNLAMCHLELNNRIHADKCWSLLLSLVAYLTYGTPGGGPSLSPNSHQDENEIFAGFMDNVSHLILSTAVTSPAA